MSEPKVRFVKAMRAVLASIREAEAIALVHGWRYSGPPNPLRQAAEAFADAVCNVRTWIEQRSHIKGKPFPVHDHTACHKALLKEIGL